MPETLPSTVGRRRDEPWTDRRVYGAGAIAPVIGGGSTTATKAGLANSPGLGNEAGSLRRLPKRQGGQQTKSRCGMGRLLPEPYIDSLFDFLFVGNGKQRNEGHLSMRRCPGLLQPLL